jgi:hypothetical protein
MADDQIGPSESRPGRFWTHDRTVAHAGLTFHVWQRGRDDAERGWQITMQPTDGTRPRGPADDFIYDSLEALSRDTGIPMEVLSPPEISDQDLDHLRRLHAKTGGKAWAPPDTGHPFIRRMVAAGLLERRDGRWGFERLKDEFVAFTEAGLDKAFSPTAPSP